MNLDMAQKTNITVLSAVCDRCARDYTARLRVLAANEKT